eukprot:g8704.t1
MRFWDFVLVICLVYTALVTPYEIAFIDPGDEVLAVINRAVDFVFVKDMVMQFFMKVERNTRQGKIWVRDRWRRCKACVWGFLGLLEGTMLRCRSEM